MDLLEPLNINLIVLQRNPEAHELLYIQERIGSGRCLDASRFDQNLADVLALLDCLSGMVGVSNTNVHLMAGLGKTADVLVPVPHEFRWQEAGDESPWFPGCKVFRQEAPTDWQPALTALRASLASRFAGTMDACLPYRPS